MTEIIQKIEELTDHEDSNSWSTKGGYRITTNQQTIDLLIDTDQQCCEDSGYFWSEDDTEQFIGAELLDISVTDTELNASKHMDVSGGSDDILFVNIVTSIGVLQFVAYNDHNGYYGHTASVRCRQLNCEKYL